PGPGVNSTCTISGAILEHLIATTDMNVLVGPNLPTNFLVQVLGQARSNSGSGFTVADSGAWETQVLRPVFELGGAGSAYNINANGNVWMWNPAFFTWQPNPAIVNGEVTFTFIFRNAGQKAFLTPEADLLLNTAVATT